jgi:LuxR family maltose regulon positive regulatory protein
LLDRLDDGRKHRLMLITAPAGYGKSTLVCAWVARQTSSYPTRRIAWLTVDEADHTPVTAQKKSSGAYRCSAMPDKRCWTASRPVSVTVVTI